MEASPNNPIRPVERVRDRTGHTVLRVPLANSKEPAEIFEEDFEAVVRAGGGPNWTFNPAAPERRYVRTQMRRASRDARAGQLETVARLVARARPGQKVKYKDGNRLNLRKTNLQVVRIQVGTGRRKRKGSVEGYAGAAQAALDA